MPDVFAMGYVRVLYRYVRAEGVSAEAVLNGTGYTESALLAAGTSMPLDAELLLCRNALAATRPGLGLRAGTQLHLASHGALGTAMQSAATLDAALSTFTRFVADRASFAGLELRSTERRTEMVLTLTNLPEELTPFFTEAVLMTLCQCIGFYSVEQQQIDVQIAYPAPAYAPAYAQALGARVRFATAETTLSFDRALLTLPSPEADAALHAQSIARCLAQRAAAPGGLQLADAIEAFLWNNPGKLWTLAEIAPTLGCSPRTAIRRLAESGQSYQGLRDQVLQQLALAHLKTMSVEATALSLGFADAASFRRAYRRWFGQPPRSSNG
ncbi:MAG: AraC family transcriptional regulator ligand-binding domain-containing protein [Pseudomonadota bacterium]